MALITSAALFGSTGHSGQYILASLLAMESTKTVYTFSRRAPKIESPKLCALIERDRSKWAASSSAIQPPPNVVLCTLAMTHAEAGSTENKWKIDHDRMLPPSPPLFRFGIHPHACGVRNCGNPATRHDSWATGDPTSHQAVAQ
ncbi:hypothetical protein F5B21DRAFT_452322 [Xylaria acuta]|nr:hypothetical protein F5B21DRAFT_452322 [Xylaria acuta]